jgi:hypothetical protein
MHAMAAVTTLSVRRSQSMSWLSGQHLTQLPFTDRRYRQQITDALLDLIGSKDVVWRQAFDELAREGVKTLGPSDAQALPACLFVHDKVL